MALVSIAVKTTSRGPDFFRQRRCGLDGQGILVCKFRTTTVCEDGNNVPQATQQIAGLRPWEQCFAVRASTSCPNIAR